MPEENYESIEGIVEEIIYANEDTGYTVMDFLTLEKNITVVGILPYLYEGESLKVIGKHTVHSEYGEQFRAELVERTQPKSRQAILNFLSSGLIKGIRAVTAKKIVDRFGERTLDILENESERLSEIKGISYLKAIEMGECYREKKGVQDLVVFLQKYGLSINLAVKINRSLGIGAVAKIENNPYVLCDSVEGIGFKTADTMAENMGVTKNSPQRIRAGIKYSLTRAALNGHTYLNEEYLESFASEILGVSLTEVSNAIISLATDAELIKETSGDEIKYYLPIYYYAEMNTANKIYMLNNHTKKKLYYASVFEDIEKLDNIVLAENQKQAVKTVLENNMAVITGGPGTGKTTVINSIISILEAMGKKVVLTAPTGRAAKRMSEVCKREAKTIHRLLEVTFSGSGDKFAKNEENPIKADIIIVDEMSMVDILLFNALLKAIKSGTRLVLVGDINQLPSVGAGNVLKDIIASGVVPCVYLNEIFRQEKESLIVVNAHKMLKKEYPTVNKKDMDFFMVRKNTSNDVISEVLSLYRGRISGFLGNKEDASIQILAPMKKSVLGTINLNNTIQEVVNPKMKGTNEKKHGNYIYREGDRIIQTKNNYELEWEAEDGERGMGVYNGDTGVIQKIDFERDTYTVKFYDGRVAECDFSKLEDMELAYAITVHKSQGSEFDAVILPLLYGPGTLLYNNLLYTAVTRAKSLVVIVGSDDCIRKMIDNDKETERFSGLKDKLKNEQKYPVF